MKDAESSHHLSTKQLPLILVGPTDHSGKNLSVGIKARVGREPKSSRITKKSEILGETKSKRIKKKRQ